MSLNVAWNVSRFTYMYQIFHFLFSRCLKVSCNDWNRYKLKQIMFPVSFNAISQHLHIMQHHAATDINLVEFFETMLLIWHFYLELHENTAWKQFLKCTMVYFTSLNFKRCCKHALSILDSLWCTHTLVHI